MENKRMWKLTTKCFSPLLIPPVAAVFIMCTMCVRIYKSVSLKKEEKKERDRLPGRHIASLESFLLHCSHHLLQILSRTYNHLVSTCSKSWIVLFPLFQHNYVHLVTYRNINYCSFTVLVMQTYLTYIWDVLISIIHPISTPFGCACVQHTIPNLNHWLKIAIGTKIEDNTFVGPPSIDAA